MRARTTSPMPTWPRPRPRFRAATTRPRANSPNEPSNVFLSDRQAGFGRTTSLPSTRTRSRIRFAPVNNQKDNEYGVESTHGICDLDHHPAGAARDSAGSQRTGKSDDAPRLADGRTGNIFTGPGS